MRATVVAAASYDPADRYVLFELRPTEVRCNGYGDVTLPERSRGGGPTVRWRHDEHGHEAKTKSTDSTTHAPTATT